MEEEDIRSCMHMHALLSQKQSILLINSIYPYSQIKKIICIGNKTKSWWLNSTTNFYYLCFLLNAGARARVKKLAGVTSCCYTGIAEHGKWYQEFLLAFKRKGSLHIQNVYWIFYLLRHNWLSKANKVFKGNVHRLSEYDWRLGTRGI